MREGGRVIPPLITPWKNPVCLWSARGGTVDDVTVLPASDRSVDDVAGSHTGRSGFAHHGGELPAPTRHPRVKL